MRLFSNDNVSPNGKHMEDLALHTTLLILLHAIRQCSSLREALEPTHTCLNPFPYWRSAHWQGCTLVLILSGVRRDDGKMVRNLFVYAHYAPWAHEKPSITPFLIAQPLTTSEFASHTSSPRYTKSAPSSHNMHKVFP